jgi:hypothetical protein
MYRNVCASESSTIRQRLNLNAIMAGGRLSYTADSVWQAQQNELLTNEISLLKRMMKP